MLIGIVVRNDANFGEFLAKVVSSPNPNQFYHMISISCYYAIPFIIPQVFNTRPVYGIVDKKW